jgi:hypothetical protein
MNTPQLYLAGVFIVFALGLFVWRSRFDRLRAKAWDSSGETPGLGLALARFLRTNARLVSIGRGIVNHAVPFAFALMLILCAGYAINKVGFDAMSATGTVCVASADSELLGAGEATKHFDIRNPCFATGISLEAGAKYRIDFPNADEPIWRDGNIEVKSRNGYNSFDKDIPWYLIFGAPMRRIIGENWFKPIARIGQYGNDEYVLGRTSTLIDAGKSGELFLYVNDAVFGLPNVWGHFYENNEGLSTVSIRKLDAPPKY